MKYGRLLAKASVPPGCSIKLGAVVGCIAISRAGSHYHNQRCRFSAQAIEALLITRKCPAAHTHSYVGHVAQCVAVRPHNEANSMPMWN